jgi:putative membrane protein
MSLRSRREEFSVRWVYLTIIVLLAAATIIFAFQNLETVTISFLSVSIRARIAILILVAYISGALTGGSLFALLRRLADRARRR